MRDGIADGRCFDDIDSEPYTDEYTSIAGTPAVFVSAEGFGGA